MIRLVLPVVLVATYALSPYVSLYEMGQAVRHGDASALATDIDWSSVRAGLKEDIADGIAGEPVPTTSPAVVSDDLPPFGASFVTNMAGSMVDRTVTPEHLAQTMNALHAAGASPAQPVLEQARFRGPTTFLVAFRPAKSPESATVRLQLDLIPSKWGMRWEVTRAWIPEAMLSQSETHSS